ncbi:MAG: 1-acyl-sn-glycerol-3-phosphate acyltransferase [Candidatus Marinimicrobia bacterium]|nr:1-acyl-sn-glycerol-3-phosphate acyltransferase [Candidatus Neomarinimicrobiota bacterium]
MKKVNFLHNILIYFLIYLGNIFIGGAIILLSPFIRRMSFYNKMIKAWGYWATLASPGKITINGLENIDRDKPYIVIANHESTVDVFYLLGRFPINMRMVAREKLRKTPFIGAAMSKSGFIFVDNKNKGRSIDHLNEQFEKLKSEKLSLMVFPEGSRFKDTLLSKFHLGAFVMAIQNNMPILLVAMKGNRGMMLPGNKAFHHSNIEIDILPEIDTSEYTYEERNDLLDKCYHLMHDHLTSMHERENK